MFEEAVAKILLKVKAVTLSPKKPYTYASGIKSPIYCDNRMLLSYPDERSKIVDYFIEIIKTNKIKADIIAGTATAGIPWAAWIADKLHKPMVYVRSSQKEHGKGNQIEGKVEQGKRVLLVEDLISTGGSSLEAVQALRNAGVVVEQCVAIFTYELIKAQQRFQEAHCKLITLSNFSKLVDVAVQTKYVTQQQREVVLAWNKDPQNWAQQQGII